ncbi:hypothetical protein [Halalkalicoccus salilacus]
MPELRALPTVFSQATGENTASRRRAIRCHNRHRFGCHVTVFDH